MKHATKPKASVVRGIHKDYEMAATFTPNAFLEFPQTVTVKLPVTKKGANDEITLEITEGDWQHGHVYLLGHMGGGLSEYPGSGGQIFGFSMRCDQVDRIIGALQLAVAEADKLGLRTPRKTPKRRTA